MKEDVPNQTLETTRRLAAGPLFHGELDKTRLVTTFKNAWQNLKQRTGIEVRWHELRHTVGTNLAESGATDETAMALMGHISRRMLTHYSHIRMEMKRKAMGSIQTKRSVLQAVAGGKK